MLSCDYVMMLTPCESSLFCVYSALTSARVFSCVVKRRSNYFLQRVMCVVILLILVEYTSELTF